MLCDSTMICSSATCNVDFTKKERDTVLKPKKISQASVPTTEAHYDRLNYECYHCHMKIGFEIHSTVFVAVVIYGLCFLYFNEGS